MLTIRRKVGIVSRFLALGLVLVACRSAPAVEQRSAGQEPPPTVAPVMPPVRTGIGFRTPQALDRHFAKHGREFRGYTRADYLTAAQRLRDRPVGGDILEVRRPDGTINRFDRRSGAFEAFDPDGTIRTFFRPNDGGAYFQRQARRRQEQ